MAAVPPLCDFGWKAIDATLMSTKNMPCSIFDCAGPNGLVIVFICNHCPYVIAVIDRIVRDANDLRKLGIGFVAISSNDVDAYPQDSFENMKIFAAENNFSFPYLYDEDQSIAKAYDAVCTPDFLGFNSAMELNYRGRLDASRKVADPDDGVRDLYTAMKQIAETGSGPLDQIASMGCSIKWKDSDE